jgi:hypothetical protein
MIENSAKLLEARTGVEPVNNRFCRPLLGPFLAQGYSDLSRNLSSNRDSCSKLERGALIVLARHSWRAKCDGCRSSLPSELGCDSRQVR